MEKVNKSYIIDPQYACKYYDLPSKEICAARYPLPVINKKLYFSWGYFSAIIMLMQNPVISRIVIKYWAIIVIIIVAIYNLI